MRVFAGPNGSGKSTIKSLISPSLLGVYINPDDIEGEISASGCLCLHNYLVETTHEDVLSFVIGSTLGTRAFVDSPSECSSSI
jgi:predicted ABC-type ATPase